MDKISILPETKIDVLDHGFVRLVDHLGNDLSVVRAARVSYDAAWRAGEDTGSDHRLIHYLMRNRHTTPFESVEFQFEVMAPISVFRQWHRHRTATINELSARYRELPEVFYVPLQRHVGVQSLSSKQARIFIKEGDPLPEDLCGQIGAYVESCQNSFRTYRALLAAGWPRELARNVLPLATYSHMFWKCDLHNLLHFLNLRTHEHAQYEIRVFAEAILKLIRPMVPVCVAAWEEQI
ncbi:FAD-dependent thymidylate synthase [Bradyrhizobium sp. Tv2a-2]|uniref:FAD-dependent thymidylate synthase n=1 Tax=Bradyrhizobium sp. Tv2a-2 TaxID=113395 RepID=UPI00041E52A9|nr:FAD-dependent thymidylate synthase [Bradyrhizobium sp. Tv2a-2]